MNPFVKDGFSNWKKGDERISGHENSSVHQVCTMKWLHQENYWIDILKRVFEAIRFLSTRGLAFRGSHEVIGVTDNSSYLGILELIAKFDPVLIAHIENYVFDHIVDEIIKSKYFGIVVDSTPDLAHIDKLSIIIRYCLNGTVHERFLGFVSFHSLTVEALGCNEVLLRNSKKSSKTLRSLSSIRCSCRNDAIEALAGNYDEIYNTLSDISKDMNENAYTRYDANLIKKKLIKLEIAFMTIFWKCVLGRFNATSVYLQRIKIDMVTGNSMLQSLITFVDELRNDFDAIENKAKISSLSVNKEWSNEGKNKRKIIQKYSDGTTGHESLKGRDTFRVNTFFVIIDKLQTELKKRSSAYDNITNFFGFLTRLDVIDDNLLKKSVNNLVKVYFRDLEESLYDDLKQFIGIVKVKEDNKLIKNPVNMLQMIVEDNLSGVFSHIYVAF
ncbi:uncharacterized protein LOC113558118 [Rhopalosiphum maidis]|uniref:uncharacterized protein LOC113558118 n=1 Tax=Rhopalosiphum maidis TaxID=43146 RepID=UPI000EFE23DF|nr:uncharacterized protein LOC113558118 [Rhopalosiphum maidis]